MNRLEGLNWSRIGWPLERGILLAFCLCCFILGAILIVYVPFPFGVLGRIWNLIVSALDHCFFFLVGEDR